MTRGLVLTAAEFTLAVAIQNIVWGVSQPRSAPLPIVLVSAPSVKGYTPMLNSIYNSPRFEAVWLDK